MDSLDFLFQVGNCVGDGSATGGVKDVPVVSLFNNGSNREVATKV